MTPNAPEIDPARCPLCGEPNRCAMELARETEAAGTDAKAEALLEQVRDARFAVDAQVPVAVTTDQVNASTAVKMKALQVRRVLLKPFKVRDVISTIQMLQDPA